MAKTYSTVPDKAAGDVFTEAMWDDFLRTNINNLIVPAACRCFNSANLSIGHNSWTDITFNSERYDTDSMHSTSVNTARITFTTPGIYTVGVLGYWASNTTGVRGLRIMLNGTTALGYVEATVGAGGTSGQCLATDYAFALNDYVTFQAFQTSGGALNLTAGGNFSPEAWATWRGRTS